MAAEICPVPGSQADKSGNKKLVLISKVECSEDINAAVFIPNEDGIISVSDDKTVRVWLKRDSGQYWPSVCHSLQSSGTCVYYNPETRRLFIGAENGYIYEFVLASDGNSLSSIRSYIGHQAAVVSVEFNLMCEWTVSVGKDKYLQWHCSETGRRLGGYLFTAPPTALVFDEASRHVFVGENSGQITMLKLGDNSVQCITMFKGHTESIRCLCWDVERKLLFSGSYDQTIIAWDIGGQKGTAYELQGHRNKVTCLAYSPAYKKLISGGHDCSVVVWDLNVTRQETAEWKQSDFCQECSKPFFWNVKGMVDQGTMGLRQHHCRRCGRAICYSCSTPRSVLPVMGFEFPVRVCSPCSQQITEADRVPLASTHEVKHNVLSMCLDEPRKRLLTAGNDRMLKIWDLAPLL